MRLTYDDSLSKPRNHFMHFSTLHVLLPLHPHKIQLDVTHRKKFYLNLRNRFFNLISSIRSKKTFRTNINLFDFKKSLFFHMQDARFQFFFGYTNLNTQILAIFIFDEN